MADTVDNPESPPPRTTEGRGNVTLNDLAGEVQHFMVTNESLFPMKFQFDQPNALNFRSSFAHSGLLQSLHLHYIEFLDSDSLRNFISRSPFLANLDFQDCLFRDFRNLDISSTSLKNLTIECCWIRPHDDYGLRNCEIKIACPSLVYIKLTVKSVSDLTFQDLNSLEYADILLKCPSDPASATIEQYHSVMRKLVEGLCKVKGICRITMPFFEFCLADGEPESISTKFNNLKCLWLVVGTNKWFMHSMINLLDCCPALENLVLEFYTLKSPFEHLEIFNKNISCFKDRLKVIEIQRFENNENELEVIKFLLKYGEKLETMSITWNADVEISEEIDEQVIEFPASSQRVIVTFKEENEDE